MDRRLQKGWTMGERGISGSKITCASTNHPVPIARSAGSDKSGAGRITESQIFQETTFTCCPTGPDRGGPSNLGLHRKSQLHVPPKSSGRVGTRIPRFFRTPTLAPDSSRNIPFPFPRKSRIRFDYGINNVSGWLPLRVASK